MTQARVAVDIGGTFTDLVRYDDDTRALTVSKILTDVEDRARGVTRALAGAGGDPARGLRDFVRGTTRATNRVIEGTTPAPALITTEGFRDVLELMRGDRPLPVYDINWRKPDALIPRSRRVEVRERLGADGSVVTPLDEAQLRALVTGEAFADVEAV